MIKKFNTFRSPNTEIHNSRITNSTQKYPLVRHFSSYESAISMLENGFLMSRNELKNHIDKLDNEFIKHKGLDSNESWWNERAELDNKNFGTEDLIFCTSDWYNNSGYETGHGPVMIYFKPSIFEDFKVTLTLKDSLEEGIRVYNDNEISKIYSSIMEESNEYINESKFILNNINHKNPEKMHNTSRGRVFIESRFYDKYAEVQIHTNKLPIEYIQELRFTDNYLYEKKNDRKNKERLVTMCKDKKMIINNDDNKIQDI